MGFRVLLLVIAGFLFLFYPVYILQLAGRFILLLTFLSWLLSRLPRFFLVVKPEIDVVRGFFHERNEIRITITNPSILPIAVLAVRDEAGGLQIDGSAAQVFHLAPRSQVVLNYQVWSNQRGMYRLGPIHIAGADPLGFFPWEIDIPEKRLAFIYPRIAPISFHSHHGLAGGPKKSHHPMFLDSTQIRSIRPYETGDDTRHIHWKASARTGSLMTSEFARTLTVPFYVILNLDEVDYHFKRRSSHIERCIEAAAAFIDQAARESYSVGFASNGIIPKDAQEVLGFESDDDGVFHLPIGSAMSNASAILSVLSVLGSRQGTLQNRADSTIRGHREQSAKPQETERRTTLIKIFEHLRYHLSPRLLIITPPLTAEDFDYVIAMIPQSCRVDFWFLDEHQDRHERIDHRDAAQTYSIHLRKLPEYGDELLNEETGRA